MPMLFFGFDLIVCFTDPSLTVLLYTTNCRQQCHWDQCLYPCKLGDGEAVWIVNTIQKLQD
jgi:hypothetical protein